jgi:hypothetical protein
MIGQQIGQQKCWPNFKIGQQIIVDLTFATPSNLKMKGFIQII